LLEEFAGPGEVDLGLMLVGALQAGNRSRQLQRVEAARAAAKASARRVESRKNGMATQGRRRRCDLLLRAATVGPEEQTSS
jgi:hypothetical protein